jgi:hypothetical protein
MMTRERYGLVLTFAGFTCLYVRLEWIDNPLLIIPFAMWMGWVGAGASK